MTPIRIIENIIFGGRWLLVPMYVAMLGVLVLLVAYFIGELAHALPMISRLSENSLLVLALSLIDLVLTANLVVLVIVSSYESFVRRVEISGDDPRPEWMGTVNFSNLKLRMLAAITVIGAVHLLRSFLDVDTESDHDLLWQVIIVLTFGTLSVLLAVTDRVSESTHKS
jgi:uncharacterized protein (TIGR00645 family)